MGIVYVECLHLIEQKNTVHTFIFELWQKSMIMNLRQ